MLYILFRASRGRDVEGPQAVVLSELITIQYEKPVPEISVLLQSYLYTEQRNRISGLDLLQNKAVSALTHFSLSRSWSTNVRSGTESESASAW